MHKCLSPGAIGIRGVGLGESLELARLTGFQSVGFDIRETAALADEYGVAYLQEMFDEARILPGTWGLPVAWNGTEQAYRETLAELPGLARVAREIGCTGTATWCPPASDDRDFEENLAWHVGRFRPIAQALSDEGCHLGIEFIGPATLRTGKQYTFIYTLPGMMGMAHEIGTGNVGLLLDAWHLYTSGGAIEDLDLITAADVVLVHVNDAPPGIPIDEQVDQVRRLPMETGVIDLPGFMRKLADLGYDGPVVAEPFSARLNEIAAANPIEAARITADSLSQLWAASGLE